MAEGNVWADPEKARRTVEEVKRLKRWIEPYHALRKRVTDGGELTEMLEAEAHVDLALQRQLEQEADAIGAQLEALELQNMLQGPDDARDALLTIHPGAGGTESQDWAEMLMRMYVRWAERHGFKVEVLDLLQGGPACEQDVLGRADHPSPVGDRRLLPAGAQSGKEQGDRHEDAQVAAVRARTRSAGGEEG